MTMPINGQMVFWNRGRRDDLKPGHNLVLVYGTLSMPPELADSFGKDERLKRLVQGAHYPERGGMMLILGDDGGERYGAEHATKRIDQLITSPIWRV